MSATIFAALPASDSLASTRAQSAGQRHLVAVPFQRAQLSVPGQWVVESRGHFFCAGQHEGMIFVGIHPRFPKDMHCRLAANFAWIVPAGHTKLGVRVGARGPQSKRILATLSRSPLSVVLAKGPVSAVPANWTKHDFGGIKFASPRTWHTQHENQWETCGTGVNQRSLQLINAKKPSVPLPCPFPYPSAANFAAVPGLTAVIGKYAAQSVAERYPRCQPRGGAKICLSGVTGTGGFYGAVLIFSVTKPHHRHPAGYFLVGLSGTGAQARAIFDSISAS